MIDLDQKSLNHLAKLCRINCSDEERKKFLHNLQSILHYVDQLKEISTENVPTCDHVSDEIEPFLRADEVSASLDRATFLANSPSHIGGMVRVPTVIKF